MPPLSQNHSQCHQNTLQLSPTFPTLDPNLSSQMTKAPDFPSTAHCPPQSRFPNSRFPLLQPLTPSNRKKDARGTVMRPADQFLRSSLSPSSRYPKGPSHMPKESASEKDIPQHQPDQEFCPPFSCFFLPPMPDPPLSPPTE